MLENKETGDKKNMKIYIISSTHAATGGTELLQQLCYQMRKMSVNALMYYTEKYDGSNVKNKFELMYNNPVSDIIEDDTTIIVPETEIDFIFKLKTYSGNIIIWWLSVDNYYGFQKSGCGFLRKLYRTIKHNRNKILFKKCIHCVQSQYAYEYLHDKISVHDSKIHYLSDYINDAYLNYTFINKCDKEDIILYNPKKGYSFTKKLINSVKEYTWVPLEGMSNSQMIEAMSKAKVYVDFGNHPGKDRIPRETAFFGCCIITGLRGAAFNSTDIPILAKYKIEDKIENIEIIHEIIKTCISNYDKCINDFSEYRQMIINEKRKFIDDVAALFVLDSKIIYRKKYF